MSKPITEEELAKHSSKNDAWIAIESNVYAVTEFIEHHPGGIGQIMRGCGTDATELFMTTHPKVNYKKILKKYYLGPLIPATPSQNPSVHSEHTHTSEPT